MVVRRYIILTSLVALFLELSSCFGQCGQLAPQSQRIANYTMELDLDTEKKAAMTSAKLLWVNSSPDTLHELRFYMYLNAFQNTSSTFLKGAGNDIFGQRVSDRPKDDWGFVEMLSISEGEGDDRLGFCSFVQPNDQNEEDQSVMSYKLLKPILPGDSIHLNYKFIAKLPRLLVRSGYSRDDFYHFTHWFPQIGVYELHEDGKWDWNCHQFHRRTEFYSDFGVYDITITAPEHLVIEGSGCKENLGTENGIQKIRFLAHDVIDFAWVAYPHFKLMEDTWGAVDIRMVITDEHSNLIPRFSEALKFSLSYMEENVGPFPYPSITVMDPPLHALRSGFMEYPQYITLGAFRYFPKGVRSVESLVVHEFVHQYFMAVLASNEKEEAWLDEGFVTYYEDRIMEALYGSASSLVDLGFFTVSNSALSRDEYTSLPDPAVVDQSRPGWDIPESYKGLVYSKTATVLKSFERIIGKNHFDNIIQSYYQKWSFLHPKASSFFDVVKKYTSANFTEDRAVELMSFIHDGIHTNKVCDYMVSGILTSPATPFVGWKGTHSNRTFERAQSEGVVSTVVVRRKGDWITPVEIKFIFEDGEVVNKMWSGDERRIKYSFDKKVTTCVVDPERKLFVDINLTNNAISESEDKKPLWISSSQLSAWIQNVLQSLTFLI